MGYGWYRVIKGIRERKYDATLSLLPDKTRPLNAPYDRKEQNRS